MVGVVGVGILTDADGEVQMGIVGTAASGGGEEAASGARAVRVGDRLPLMDGSTVADDVALEVCVQRHQVGVVDDGQVMAVAEVVEAFVHDAVHVGGDHRARRKREVECVEVLGTAGDAVVTGAVGEAAVDEVRGPGGPGQL